MLKKTMKVKCQKRFSGADRKKLIKTIYGAFPNASDDDIEALFPPKVEIIVTKYLNRALVYSLKGGFPMFFKVDSRDTQILPTVFALWKVPKLLPAFVLKGAEVSRAVIEGADLTFSGTFIPLKGLKPFLAGEKWSVKVPGNPAPIAVGTTTMSSSEALEIGLQGNVLKIIHFYRDPLWELVEGCHVPNAGFLEDVVLEDPSSISSCHDTELFEQDVSIYNENGMNNTEFQDDIASTVEHSPFDPSFTMLNDIERTIKNLMSITVDLKVLETVPFDQLSAKNQQSVTDIDAILDQCLLQALHTTVSKKDLPMRASTLWSNHVLLCRPPDIMLDIKRSSHKKLTKWLHLKSSAGLISVKEDKYKKEAMLCGVNYNHPEYTSFKLENWKSDQNEQDADHIANGGCSDKMTEMAEMYKSTPFVKHIFASVGADKKKFFRASEVTDIIISYINKENLVKPTDESIVVLDAPLSEALFLGADAQVFICPYEIEKNDLMTSSDSEASDYENLVKSTNESIVVPDAPLSNICFEGVGQQRSIFPCEINKKDLVATFFSRMQAYHLVKRGSLSVLRKGALKMIKIMTGRRHGNKKVTQLSGLESYLIDAETLASELKKKFSCITSVVVLPGKKTRAVVVHGGGSDHFARYLVEQYGISRSNIQVFKRAKM